jgi:hypothetical protein
MLQALKEYVGRDFPKNGGEYGIFDPFEEVLSKNGNTMTLIPARGQYLDGGFVEGWLHANNVVVGAS